jgi:hypothetical protein
MMVNTAIRPVSRIFLSHSGKEMPYSEYDKVLFWIIDPVSFLHSLMLKWKIQRKIAGLLIPALSLLLFINCHP